MATKVSCSKLQNTFVDHNWIMKWLAELLDFHLEKRHAKVTFATCDNSLHDGVQQSDEADLVRIEAAIVAFIG